MNEVIAPLLARFDALSLRERVLVALVAAAIIWVLWSQTLDRWMGASVAAQRAEVAALASQRDAARATHARLQQTLENASGVARAQERDALLRHRVALEAQLEGRIQRFVTPDQMRIVLEDLLGRHRGVALETLTSLPPEPLRVTANGSEVPGVYRHAIRLELTGSYRDLTDYLAAVEARPWRFMWQSLSYEVAEHPRGRMRVVIETLSHDRFSLGV